MIELIVADSRKEAFSAMQSSLRQYSWIKAVRARPDQLWTVEGLDAIYMSRPMAERWGAKPILYKAEVLKTSEPIKIPYIVTGGVMHPDDPHNLGFEVRFITFSVLQAASTFNEIQKAQRIHCVALSTQTLGISEDDCALMVGFIRQVHEDFFG